MKTDRTDEANLEEKIGDVLAPISPSTPDGDILAGIMVLVCLVVVHHLRLPGWRRVEQHLGALIKLGRREWIPDLGTLGPFGPVRARQVIAAWPVVRAFVRIHDAAERITEDAARRTLIETSAAALIGGFGETGARLWLLLVGPFLRRRYRDQADDHMQEVALEHVDGQTSTQSYRPTGSLRNLRRYVVRASAWRASRAPPDRRTKEELAPDDPCADLQRRAAAEWAALKDSERGDPSEVGKAEVWNRASVDATAAAELSPRSKARYDRAGIDTNDEVATAEEQHRRQLRRQHRTEGTFSANEAAARILPGGVPPSTFRKTVRQMLTDGVPFSDTWQRTRHFVPEDLDRIRPRLPFRRRPQR